MFFIQEFHWQNHGIQLQRGFQGLLINVAEKIRSMNVENISFIENVYLMILQSLRCISSVPFSLLLQLPVIFEPRDIIVSYLFESQEAQTTVPYKSLYQEIGSIK